MSLEDNFPGRGFFEAVYRGAAPWDIGEAQPDLLELIREWPPQGLILDLGCGTGDLAIALAALGHRVLGVDFVSAAVEEARERSAALPAGQRERLEFLVGDALRPSKYSGRVGAITDSGFFHLFDAPVRRELVDELGRALPHGGRFYLLGFAVALPAPDVPRQVTERELRELFSSAAGWAVRSLRPARFRTRGFDDIPAVAMCAERAMP